MMIDHAKKKWWKWRPHISEMASLLPNCKMRMGALLKKDLPTLALDFAPQPKYLVLQFQIVFCG